MLKQETGVFLHQLQVFDHTTGVATLSPPDPNSLSHWMALYWQLRVLGSPEKTTEAKRRDLKRFAKFFVTSLNHDHVDGWTPAVTKYFQTNLSQIVSPKFGRALKATSVNRIMASLRHFARWLHKQRPLLAGSPIESVKDISVEMPAWNGLSSVQIMRLKSACEQRLKSCARSNQNPLLETTVLHVLLHTGLRANELSSLNFGQYHHRGFHDVKRKGSRVSKKISIPTEARDLLERYIDERRGRAAGPLFLTRYGKRLTPLNIAHVCERLAEQANVHVNANEAIHLTPHMLRHTFLKRVADKHGVHVAQEMSGNRSIREIFRYTKPSETEVEQTAESLFL